MSDQLVSETTSWQHDKTQLSQQTPMTPSEFKPTISADKRPQTYTLGRAATGTDIVLNTVYQNDKYNNNNNNNNN